MPYSQAHHIDNSLFLLGKSAFCPISRSEQKQHDENEEDAEHHVYVNRHGV